MELDGKYNEIKRSGSRCNEIRYSGQIFKLREIHFNNEVNNSIRALHELYRSMTETLHYHQIGRTWDGKPTFTPPMFG